MTPSRRAGKAHDAWPAAAADQRVHAPPPGPRTDITVTIFNRVAHDDRHAASQRRGRPDGRKLAGRGGDPHRCEGARGWSYRRQGIVERSRATLNFGADGRVSGRASCNTTAQYTLTGEGSPRRRPPHDDGLPAR
jgi:hypothetical protein